MKIFKIISLVSATFVGLLVLGHVLGFIGETTQVVHEEASPRAMLDKYDHFKDMAAQLDAKKSNIETAQASIARFEQDYNGVAKKDWPRDERESYNQKQSELMTMKQSYNALAAEYNADMAKINYAFTNVGSLPKGRDQVLPREYRIYITT